MKRVLHVFGGLGTGGTESLIMNWYRNIDRTKIQFDFLVRSRDDNYIQEITELGGRVFYTSPFPRHFLHNYRETKRILAQKEWDMIHVHGNAAMYMLPLKLASRLGYPIRIMHSHSTQAQNKLFSRIHFFNRRQIPRHATHLLACSAAAGEWMYGQKDFTVIRNTVPFENYAFDQAARHSLRSTLTLEDKFVIGHVGRFSTPKNHSFLLDIFSEIKKLRPDSILMLVGDGDLQPEIEQKATAWGLYNSVLFMGRRNDIGSLMSAMDVFVLPSLYEGLGNVLIEAQFNGLPCVVSEEAHNPEIPSITQLSTVSLTADAHTWANHILETSTKTYPRQIEASVIVNSGYDIKTEIPRLESIYLQETKG